MAARLGRKPSLSVREMNLNANNSKPWWPPNVGPAQGCAQHLADHDGRSGLRDLRHVGWRLSNTRRKPLHRANGTALHDVSFDRPLFRRTRLAGFLEPRFPRPPRMFEAAFGHFTRDRVRSGRVSQRICGCWLPYNPERAQRLLMSCSLTFPTSLLAGVVKRDDAKTSHCWRHHDAACSFIC